MLDPKPGHGPCGVRAGHYTYRLASVVVQCDVVHLSLVLLPCSGFLQWKRRRKRVMVVHLRGYTARRSRILFVGFVCSRPCVSSIPFLFRPIERVRHVMPSPTFVGAKPFVQHAIHTRPLQDVVPAFGAHEQRRTGYPRSVASSCGGVAGSAPLSVRCRIGIALRDRSFHPKRVEV